MVLMRKIFIFFILFSLYSFLFCEEEISYTIVDTRYGEIFCVISDNIKGKLYVGTRSYDYERKGLMVFDIDKDGNIINGPRRYSDHPDFFPDPVPGGGWSVINTMYLSKKYNKIYLGVSVASIPEFSNFRKGLVVYELDNNGEPKGKPIAFDTLTSGVHSIAIHPKINRLYYGAWGTGRVYAFDLDSNGIPQSSPIFYDIGGDGKYKIEFNPEGNKIYLGTYPSILQIGDLDEKGNVLKVKYYPVEKGPREYLIFAYTDKAIFFKGENSNLSYFLLDKNGDVYKGPIIVENFPIQAVSCSDVKNRVIVAFSSEFKDAVNNKNRLEGFYLKEVEISYENSNIKITRETGKFYRKRVVALNGYPSVGIGVVNLTGFLGNRISGVEFKITIKNLETNENLPISYKKVKISSENKYLKFKYSSKYKKLYAVENDNLLIFDIENREEKVSSFSVPGINGPMEIDEEKGLIYTSTKNGKIEVIKLDDNGEPLSIQETINSGVSSIKLLFLNPEKNLLYVVGNITNESPSSSIICRVPGFEYDIDGVLSTKKNKLYIISQYNKNENLKVWEIDKDGKLISNKPKIYKDGFFSESKRTVLGGICIDEGKSKLYLCGTLEYPTKEGEAGIVVYNLDSEGYPYGEPKLINSKLVAPWDIALTPDKKKIFLVGWGSPTFLVWELDKEGNLTGAPLIFHTSGDGKSQISFDDDMKYLLLGSHPSILEILPMDKNWIPRQGIFVSFGTDKGHKTIGHVPIGKSSEWINLDEYLKDQYGIARFNFNLSGCNIKKGEVEFEFIKRDANEIKKLKKFNVKINGNLIFMVVPFYGIDDPDKYKDLIKSSIEIYNDYLLISEKVSLKEDEKPKKFIISNCLYSIDDTEDTLEYGLKMLSNLGHNVVSIVGWNNLSQQEKRQRLEKYGFNRFRGAIYNPPSYFDYEKDLVKEEFLDSWVSNLKKNVNISMGNKDDEMILFHIADEPGWYYPGIVENLKGKESRLEVFRNYLDSKGFTPEFFGKEIWNEIFPLNLSEIKTKGDKKIFYWTTRFFAESLSNAFSLATKAFVKNYNKKILTTTNLNNWPGRFFIPSPGKHIGNNPDRGPNAAMGAPDWFDLGRKKAVTCIWTEDWFGDNSAQLWSFYGDLLRCAARQGDIEFGGYIVGQGLGSVEDGGKYKTLALIGHGAKAVEFYIFGPYYAFIDGWSENKNAYKSIADALRLVGKAEELLFLGRPKDGTVAILFPISSQVWDNDSSLPLYLLELYGLHEGLIHENYPVDFIDDFDVENGILKNKNYSVLYVTAPNLSEKAQRQILNYVKNGGILVLMPGACAFDEYNEPLSIITEKSETKNIQVKRESSAAIEKEKRLEKSIIFKEKLFDFKNIISIKFQSVPLEVKNGKIVAEYNDGTPAISEVKYEKGIIISYGFWPGVNYHFSQDNNRGDRLPIGWDENIRKIITYPALIANTKKYVEISESLVEGCYLISEKGIAIVLLNWSGKPLSNIDLIIDGVKNCKFVKSVELGKVLNHEKINENKIKINLPLKTVDIVLIFFE